MAYAESPRGYDELKELSKSSGRNITDLIALSRNNDPFFAGAPAQTQKAEWFAGLWREFGFTDGVHLRRIHYRLVSQREPKKEDGSKYENTESAWNYLCEAGKAARYLGLVPAESFVDRRNPSPHCYVNPEGDLSPGWLRDEYLNPSLPEIEADLGWQVSLDPPAPLVTGYDYRACDQPFHIELWVEKSTMDDVLLPICEELGVNLVTSLGFQSITGVLALLRRIEASGKPGRIFYISDFDPAGDGMPTAVARQVEYWRAEYTPDSEVKLNPLVLTRGQVGQYRLPRIPVKDSDLRKASFENRHGEGAVELDALEALYPGTLAEIVRKSIEPYQDLSLSRRMRQAEREAEAALRSAWKDLTAPWEDEISAQRDEAEEILSRFQERLQEIREEMAEELAPVQERAENVWLAIRESAEGLEVELPERPEPDLDLPDEDDWLLDTNREYLDQLEVYRVRRSGE